MIVTVAAATAAVTMLGALWYSPSMFGKKWAGLAFPGKKYGDVGGSKSAYLYATVGQACVCTALYFILKVFLGAHGLVGCTYYASWIAGLVFASQIPHGAFLNRKLESVLIDSGYDAACVMLASAIIATLG